MPEPVEIPLTKVMLTTVGTSSAAGTSTKVEIPTTAGMPTT
jgi:hypothetical protein